MLFGPFALQSGAAMAMVPSDHQSEMSKSGHCAEQQQQDDQDGNKAGKSCCIAMCAAAAVAGDSAPQPNHYSIAGPAPLQDDFVHGFLAKLPTPPPRLS